MLTNKLLLMTLNKILIKTTSFSYIEKNHIEKINKLYYLSLSNIKVMLQNNKMIRDKGYELFENQWNLYISSSDICNMTTKLVSTHHLLLPFNIEEIEDFPLELQIPKNDLEVFSNRLIVFIMLYDIRIGIYKEGDFLKKRFPLKLGDIDVKTMKKYAIKGNNFLILDLNNEYLLCQLKNSSYTQLTTFIIIIYNNYCLLCLPDDKDNVFIKYIHSLRNVEVQIDRSNPRTLILVANEVSLFYFKKNSINDYYIECTDVSKAMTTKNYIEENRKSIRNTEYLLLDSYIEDLLNKWTF